MLAQRAHDLSRPLSCYLDGSAESSYHLPKQYEGAIMNPNKALWEKGDFTEIEHFGWATGILCSVWFVATVALLIICCR